MKKPNRTKTPLLRYNLRYFDAGEKTEKATSKRRKEARDKGQVAKSQEVGTAFLLLSVFFALGYFAASMLAGMMRVITYCLSLIGESKGLYDIDFISKLISGMFAQAVLIPLPLMIAALAVGMAANLMQVGWHPTSEPLRPKLSKLNPISGFKKLFSTRALMELAKSIAKFSVILLVLYNVMKRDVQKIPFLMELEIAESLMFIGDIIVRMGLNVGALFLFVALGDYVYTRFKHEKDLRMSKHEVKEEFKQAEGNPQIKGKIKQKMREVSMRRMMQSVPQADVIITNPTHYAVALQYDNKKSEAPLVVAKGTDYLAKRIREKAEEHHIEIVENVELARTLYATVDIGRQIPPELYQAVAEVLAFVYKLRNKTA